MRGLTQEQLQERLNYITATDVPVILGLSPWGNIIELWRQKVGLTQQEDISDKPHVKAGLYLEPVIANWFADETGKKLEVDESLAIHPQLPYLAAHTDRVVVGEPSILECKTASRANGWGEVGSNSVPDYYLAQVAHEALCWEADRCYIAVLIGGFDFRHHYKYERNEKLEKMIIEKCKAFWDCVKNEVPPEPRTSDEVVSLYGYTQEEGDLAADGDIQNELEQLKEIKIKIKEFQEKQQNAENKIKVFMSDKTTLYGTDGKIAATWKLPKPTERFDQKRFKDEKPELYKEYATSTQSQRRFLLK
jgi:putative phage-type endonuclease